MSYFETAWKPKRWDQRFRFVFVRTRTKKQYKGPVQLDLFIPHEYGYKFNPSYSQWFLADSEEDQVLRFRMR